MQNKSTLTVILSLGVWHRNTDTTAMLSTWKTISLPCYLLTPHHCSNYSWQQLLHSYVCLSPWLRPLILKPTNRIGKLSTPKSPRSIWVHMGRWRDHWEERHITSFLQEMLPPSNVCTDSCIQACKTCSLGNWEKWKSSHVNALPWGTTEAAWARWPSSRSNSLHDANFRLLCHSPSSSWRSCNLSSGKCNWHETVSMAIPRNVMHVAEPSVLCITTGIHKSSKYV